MSLDKFTSKQLFSIQAVSINNLHNRFINAFSILKLVELVKVVRLLVSCFTIAAARLSLRWNLTTMTRVAERPASRKEPRVRATEIVNIFSVSVKVA